jgi:hypothetical protein
MEKLKINMPKKEDLLFNFSIDRGGTFTDIYVEILDS